MSDLVDIYFQQLVDRPSTVKIGFTRRGLAYRGIELAKEYRTELIPVGVGSIRAPRSDEGYYHDRWMDLRIAGPAQELFWATGRLLDFMVEELGASPEIFIDGMFEARQDLYVMVHGTDCNIRRGRVDLRQAQPKRTYRHDYLRVDSVCDMLGVQPQSITPTTWPGVVNQSGVYWVPMFSGRLPHELDALEYTTAAQLNVWLHGSAATTRKNSTGNSHWLTDYYLGKRNGVHRYDSTVWKALR